jgi:tRNA nucleotidyltransferase (CCA-adding enzyme)
VSEPNPLELVQRLEAQLSPQALSALQELRSLTDAAALDLYLVGGAVRDLLLQRPNLDLDLAIEADVAPIAEALAAATGGRAVLHPRFGTSTISGPGFHLDLARTRREAYAQPGALPTVEPATLADDLKRRDFTINAMALRLTRAASVLDPHGGLQDLASQQLRVLHEKSFQDDSTRMFRAMRYAERLGFGLAPQTGAWLARDLTYLNTLTPQRIRRELQILFEEDVAPEATLLADRNGIVRTLHPKLGLDESRALRWREALDAPYHHSSRDELGLLLILRSYEPRDTAEISRRLALEGRFTRALHDFTRLWDDADGSTKLAAMRNDPVSAVELLEPLTASAVWAMSIIAAGPASETCLEYLSNWRHLQPKLRGDDVIALGVQPGVAVGDTLRALRNARLTGAVTTREEEEALVRALLQKTAH